MLTFLRRIRKSLIESGSAPSDRAIRAGRRYVLYAIGEILLVMIGILLALQVNNWNEERKNIKAEKELYENLLINLRGDSTDLIRILERVSSAVRAQRILIQNPYDSLTANYTTKELERIVRSVNSIGNSFIPRINSYNQIINSGMLPLIRSEKIKNALVDLYDRSYQLYAHIDAVVEQKNQFYLHPIIKGELQLFHPAFNLELPEKFDQQLFKTLFDDLVKECRSSYVISSASRNILTNIQSDVSALIHLIREELGE